MSTCCAEPGCDKTNCAKCHYLWACRGDPQRLDYCPRPRVCPGCGANCTSCPLWQGPIIRDFSKMTEGQALYSLGARAAEKDGKKGLSLPMPGKPGETLFVEASDEKPGGIVASANKANRLKGAKKTRCADCRCKVWISPSSQEMLRRYPGTPVICIACCMKRIEEEKRSRSTSCTHCEDIQASEVSGDVKTGHLLY